jgi:hypothetical protein
MFLVVLKGGSEFATDLTRAIRKQHTYTKNTHLPFTVDYVRVKSYEGTESSGKGASRFVQKFSKNTSLGSLSDSRALAHTHRHTQRILHIYTYQCKGNTGIAEIDCTPDTTCSYYFWNRP